MKVIIVKPNDSDIILHFDKNVNPYIKLAFKEFRKWLKNKISFPIKINIYVTSSYRVVTKKQIKATGIFTIPSTKNKYPFIKLATADFEDLKSEVGYYNGMMSILHTFAHEVIHYQQWIREQSFNERLADKEATKLVEEYSDYKMGFLTANKKTLSIIKKAYDYYDRKKYIYAIKYFNSVASEDSEFGVIFKDIGDAYSSLDKYEQAIAYYNKMIDLNENDYDLYISKGYALDMLSRYDEAILCYDYAIMLNPEEEVAYLNKGYSLFCKKNLLESIIYFDKAIEINTESEDAFIFKAQVMEKLCKWDMSIDNYNRTIKINPNNIISLSGKGRVLFILGEYEECIEIINKGIQIYSQNAETYYYKALSYVGLNQIEKCIINLKKSIELDKEYKNIAKQDSFFNSISNLNEFIKLVE